MPRGRAPALGSSARVTSTTPRVVIAHGAWADATSWREVIALLQARGLRVVAVQNPLSALADDVDAVTRLLDHQPGPVVLVGHGYGGSVITQAGIHKSVAGLVYIAGWAPDVGESTADLEKDHSSLPLSADSKWTPAGFSISRRMPSWNSLRTTCQRRRAWSLRPRSNPFEPAHFSIQEARRPSAAVDVERHRDAGPRRRLLTTRRMSRVIRCYICNLAPVKTSAAGPGRGARTSSSIISSPPAQRRR